MRAHRLMLRLLVSVSLLFLGSACSDDATNGLDGSEPIAPPAGQQPVGSASGNSASGNSEADTLSGSAGQHGAPTPSGAAPDDPTGCAAVNAEWPEAWAAFEQEVVTLVNQRRAAGANCGGQATLDTEPPVPHCHRVRISLPPLFASLEATPRRADREHPATDTASAC